MSWQDAIVVTLLGLTALLTVAQVDKPREPTTHRTAVINLILTGVLVWLVVTG